MAEDLDLEDKTEEPSERRLEEARKEGRVPLSRDAVLVAGLATGAMALIGLSGSITQALIGSVRHVGMNLDDERLLPEVFGAAVAKPVTLILTVLALGAASAIIVTLAQTRGGFWLSLLAPTGERMFSLSKVTHVFTKDGVVDIGVATLKAALLLGVAWTTVSPAVRQLRGMLYLPASQLLEASWAPVVSCLPRLFLALIALAALDVFITRRRYFGRMRMTKDELKREHKEEEGDPYVRARRKRKHREMVQGRVAVEVPRADALVVNPTHIAVAIRYRKKNDKAPRVTAKGKGVQAQLMRELAAKHGVPIVRDVALARLMHKKVKVGREVPAEVFRAVAAVLATVYRLTGRPPGTGND